MMFPTTKNLFEGLFLAKSKYIFFRYNTVSFIIVSITHSKACAFCCIMLLYRPFFLFSFYYDYLRWGYEVDYIFWKVVRNLKRLKTPVLMWFGTMNVLYSARHQQHCDTFPNIFPKSDSEYCRDTLVVSTALQFYFLFFRNKRSVNSVGIFKTNKNKKWWLVLNQTYWPLTEENVPLKFREGATLTLSL